MPGHNHCKPGVNVGCGLGQLQHTASRHSTHGWAMHASCQKQYSWQDSGDNTRVTRRAARRMGRTSCIRRVRRMRCTRRTRHAVRRTARLAGRVGPCSSLQPARHTQSMLRGMQQLCARKAHRAHHSHSHSNSHQSSSEATLASASASASSTQAAHKWSQGEQQVTPMS